MCIRDRRRTPKFAKAIRARLAELQDAVVLDLGTGPFCVLALIAATAGAKKVYAVEANPEAARRAKAFIAKCEDPNASRRDVDGLVPLAPGLIEVIEGFSTELTLPEKVDLCVFEICGSLASEAYACVEINQCVGCSVERRGTGIATPSSRRRVDGVEDDAANAP